MNFEEVRARYIKAKEYFDTKYETDTQKNKELADKKIKAIEKQLDELWPEYSTKVIPIDLKDSTEQEEIIQELLNDFWTGKVNCYTKRNKIEVILKLPQFLKYANVLEG